MFDASLDSECTSEERPKRLIHMYPSGASQPTVVYNEPLSGVLRPGSLTKTVILVLNGNASLHFF